MHIVMKYDLDLLYPKFAPRPTQMLIKIERTRFSGYISGPRSPNILSQQFCASRNSHRKMFSRNCCNFRDNTAKVAFTICVHFLTCYLPSSMFCPGNTTTATTSLSSHSYLARYRLPILMFPLAFLNSATQILG
jgi:hypothetical protein